VHWIFAHSNAGKIVFIEKGGFGLRKSKISERFVQVEHFLACWASHNKISLRGGKRHVILALTLSRNRATIQH